MIQANSLSCERENKWLDEAAYSVDTANVPRGGHRRRKSMEPRALANLNGTIIASSTTTPSKTPRSSVSPRDMTDRVTTSKSRRRESVEWVRSPASSSSDKLDEIMPLSPATPAFGATTYGEDGLYGVATPDGQTPYFLHKENIVQKTAPVKKYTNEDGDQLGFLSEKKDETVMMRLMAARRKSLQWAPKVGSPLARGDF